MEYSPGRTAGAYRNYVFWFRYLFPDAAQAGGLFQRDVPRDNQDVRMTGGSFREDPETLDIETGHQAGDDLNITGIAGAAVINGYPRGFGPRPVHEALAWAGLRNCHG
jgi:hypothetical protein